MSESGKIVTITPQAFKGIKKLGDKLRKAGVVDADEDQELSGVDLLSYIERIERLAEEKDGLTADIRDIYNQAKSTGFDTKAMREVIKRRKMDRGEVDELDNLVHLYEQAAGGGE